MLINDVDLFCDHRKILVRWSISSDRQRDRAIVTCKGCGFSIEIEDSHLTEEGIKYEFNRAVRSAMVSRRRFHFS